MMKRQCDRVLASFIGVSLNSDVARLLQSSCSYCKNFLLLTDCLKRANNNSAQDSNDSICVTQEQEVQSILHK
jgi:hypothetical protein